MRVSDHHVFVRLQITCTAQYFKVHLLDLPEYCEKALPEQTRVYFKLFLILARDHGIPSYNNYRALCNLKRAATFEDLAREIPAEVIARLKRIYPTVDDIDLFPGGMSERPLQGGLVGPTFACIMAIQFRQLRKCDRFW